VSIISDTDLVDLPILQLILAPPNGTIAARSIEVLEVSNLQNDAGDRIGLFADKNHHHLL
jgi:hypothetical protein